MAEEPRCKFFRFVVLIILIDFDFKFLQLFVGITELRLAGEKRQFFSPEVDGFGGELEQFIGIVNLIVYLRGLIP